MSTVAHTVRTCVEEDPYLRFCMARGVISHAKLARWLQRERDMPGTEHAIISALRRMDMSEETPPLDEGRRTLANARIEIQDRVLCFEVPREEHALERIGRLEGELDEVIKFEGEASITLVVPDNADETAEEILGEYYVDAQKNGLSLIRILLPEGGESPPALLYASDQLNREGIEILECHTSPDLIRILIHEADGAKAYRLLIEGKPDHE